MQRDGEPQDARSDEGASRNPVSVALLAAMAFVPLVVAAGFLTDRAAVSVPADISVLALRGMIDAGPAARPAPPARAGY